MEENKKKIIKSVITICMLLIVGSVILINFTSAPYVLDIEINESKRFEDKVVFNISVGNSFLKFDKDTWCYITKDALVPDINDKEWVKAENGYCSFTTDSGLHNIYVKDSFGNISDMQSQKVQINKVLRVDLNKESIYMYKGRKEKLTYTITKLGNPSEDITWKVQDANIAQVDSDGTVTALNYGTTYVEAISSTGTIGKTKVIVSSYITKPAINSKKSYLSCNQFTSSEAEMLDSALLDRIESAGYGTRAGVVAAARFLTLEFNFRVHYFFENGRLENYGPYMKVDGEGRYYHKGLYLSETKFNNLAYVGNGPAIWGCGLRCYEDAPPYFKPGLKYPNGLSCSGFVTWVLYNAGFDVGDIGAGESAYPRQLTDTGKFTSVTPSLIKSGKIKVGDLFNVWGHISILVGEDSKNYYIAESLDLYGGVVINTYSKSTVKESFPYVVLMDEVYKEDGNLTDLWY